jgi:hypothetical protein
MRFFALAAAAVLMASPALAGVTGGLTGGTAFINGGTVQIIAPPAAVGEDNFNDDTVRVFAERQRLLLTSPLSIDVVAGTIAAGTVVSSYTINFDPANRGSAQGSVTFNGPILGLIITQANWINSNSVLGAPGTTYFSPAEVGLELGDIVSFAGNSVGFSFEDSSPGDSIRVITAAVVPEPASWMMMLIGFGMISAALRRKQRAASA